MGDEPVGLVRVRIGPDRWLVASRITDYRLRLLESDDGKVGTTGGSVAGGVRA